MNEKIGNSFESGPKHMPLSEEVDKVFDVFIGNREGGKESTVTSVETDDTGLKKKVVSIEKGGGNRSQYEYGRYNPDNSGGSSTSVYLTHFSNGVATGGEHVAKFSSEHDDWVSFH